MDLPMSSCHTGWKTSPSADYYNGPPSSTQFPKRIESGIGVRPELPLSNCWFGIAQCLYCCSGRVVGNPYPIALRQSSASERSRSAADAAREANAAAYG
jgi:hypothetical protein